MLSVTVNSFLDNIDKNEYRRKLARGGNGKGKASKKSQNYPSRLNQLQDSVRTRETVVLMQLHAIIRLSVQVSLTILVCPAGESVQDLMKY